MTTFRQEIEKVINMNSKENGSDTPDWILAHYLDDCLRAYDSATIQREIWYGRKVGGGEAITGTASREPNGTYTIIEPER